MLLLIGAYQVAAARGRAPWRGHRIPLKSVTYYQLAATHRRSRAPCRPVEILVIEAERGLGKTRVLDIAEGVVKSIQAPTLARRRGDQSPHQVKVGRDRERGRFDIAGSWTGRSKGWSDSAAADRIAPRHHSE
jgi:hypothetical protein